MTTNNPPSAAATARASDATQTLKRSVAAAFDGEHNIILASPFKAFLSPSCVRKTAC